MTTPARILFVDDEQNVLDAMRDSLWRMRRAWTMSFVCGGPAAVDAMHHSAFDVIVTDMRMPVVDGEAVLHTAVSTAPGAIRIILSGQTDRAVASRATSLAHRFLSKPCNAEDVRDCVTQMLEIASPMTAPMREVVCGVGELPIAESSSSRLASLLLCPNPNRTEIIQCIEQDIGLTAKLLHVAGSGFFAKRQSVTSVSGVLTTLGIEVVREFAATARARTEHEQQAWILEHSLATGRLMTRLSQHQHAFLCGILHGVGKLAMLHRFGDDYAKILRRAATTPSCSLYQLELDLFDIGHDEVAAKLVELWGLPPAISVALRRHSTPVRDDDELTLALHAACALSHGTVKLDEDVIAGKFEALR